MNEQKSTSSNHIEWTRVILPDGTRTRGYTWNPIAGCQHGCRWQMPDGKVAECYAENVAENVASLTYPNGFAHHYWKPQLLNEPIKLKQGAGIFIGSMADVFGAWVPDEQIEAVLDTCRKAQQHIFFVLTKNAPRLLKFEFPDNVWVGASSPPDFMFGKALSVEQREAMLHRTLKVLTEVKAKVRWMSIEPLSHDYSSIFRQYPAALNWAVIGAASDGKRKFPPSEEDLRNTLDVLDDWAVTIFYKGNMRSLPYAAANWREAFPASAFERPAPPADPEPLTIDWLEAERAGSDERIEALIADLPAAVDVTPLAPKPSPEPDYADPYDLPTNSKVISLWQPWATLMLIGAKQIETRSWQTPFKGTLVIHAAKKWDKDLQAIANSEPFASVLRIHGYDPNALPLGAALGAVILDRCVSVDKLGALSQQEYAFGDYSEGRFGWLTSRPRPFREPLPVAGEQGLRDWSSYLAKIGKPLGFDEITAPEAPTVPQTAVVNFNHVYQHWDKRTRRWDDPRYVYIGRFMPSFNLASSLFANPFKIKSDTPENRAAAIEQYRLWLKGKLADPQEGEAYRTALEGLRGKTLVCWCADPDPAKSKACHGDVLLSLLGEPVEHIEPPQPEQPPVQMSMFGDELPVKKMKIYA
jgi:protein gp37